jgi:hypothetical protein
MNLYCVSILDMKLILNLDSLRFKSQFESWFDNHDANSLWSTDDSLLFFQIIIGVSVRVVSSVRAS